MDMGKKKGGNSGSLKKGVSFSESASQKDKHTHKETGNQRAQKGTDRIQLIAKTKKSPSDSFFISTKKGEVMRRNDRHRYDSDPWSESQPRTGVNKLPKKESIKDGLVGRERLYPHHGIGPMKNKMTEGGCDD